MDLTTRYVPTKKQTKETMIMKNIWTKKWKNVLIWFSGYFSFIAFAITGGYAIVKSEDEELKKTAKTAFVVTLIFACISAFLTIFSNFGSMSDNYYGSGAYDFYSIFSSLVAVGKIITYVVFIILELAKKDPVVAEPVAVAEKVEEPEKKVEEPEKKVEEAVEE